MLYIATRRVGNNAWVRIADLMLPNIHQWPPNFEDHIKERFFSRPQMTNWTVPLDDTHTMIIGFMHIDESSGVDYEKVKNSFGQTGDRPYEERQYRPGDYDAQTSQRPIAIHGLERLVSSDGGVIMFRRLIRDGIRAAREGQDPKGIIRTGGEAIPTFSQETILAVPPPEADRQLLKETGRRVAEGHLS